MSRCSLRSADNTADQRRRSYRPDCLTRCYFTSYGYRCDDCGSLVADGMDTASPGRPGTPNTPRTAKHSRNYFQALTRPQVGDGWVPPAFSRGGCILHRLMDRYPPAQDCALTREIIGFSISGQNFSTAGVTRRLGRRVTVEMFLKIYPTPVKPVRGPYTSGLLPLLRLHSR